MAGKGDGDGWALFVDMRDAPWSVSGWGWWDGGGVDQGLAELGKERVVLWPRVAKVSCAEKPSAPHQPEHPPHSLQMGNMCLIEDESWCILMFCSLEPSQYLSHIFRGDIFRKQYFWKSKSATNIKCITSHKYTTIYL